MTPEEIAAKAALLKEVKETAEAQTKELKATIETLKGEKKDVADKVAAIEAQLKDIKNHEQVSVLVKELSDLAVKVKGMEEKPMESEKGMNLKDALTAAFAEKKDEIDAIVKANGKQRTSLNIEVKTVGTMSVESTIGAGSTQNTITQNTGIISTIRKRELTYLAHVSVGSIGTNRAVWIEETDEEGTPIMLGEGDAKTQLDVQYVEQTMAVKKIAVYGKVTTELMSDIPQLISYIQNNLMKRMDIVLEDQYFSGSGVGDNLKGAITYATAFDAGALAATITDPNELDVIEAVALQCKLAFGQPNVIFVHPSTMSKIKLIKDDAGRPVWKDYITIDGSLKISGMQIVESTAITAGDYVGGDFSVVNVLNRENLGIQIGLDGNDFTQNKKTMLVEKRIAQFVSANDTACLITGTFEDDIVTLDANPAP